MNKIFKTAALAALVTVGPLAMTGTAAAQSQLRSVVSAVGAALTAQPEIYLNYRDGLIVDGEITDDAFRGVLVDWSAKFSEWIARLRAPALTS